MKNLILLALLSISISSFTQETTIYILELDYIYELDSKNKLFTENTSDLLMSVSNDSIVTTTERFQTIDYVINIERSLGKTIYITRNPLIGNAFLTIYTDRVELKFEVDPNFIYIYNIKSIYSNT